MELNTNQLQDLENTCGDSNLPHLQSTWPPAAPL